MDKTDDVNLSKDYIEKAKELLTITKEAKAKYKSLDRVTKEHNLKLKDYMINNKLKSLDGIVLNKYKGYFYLKLETDIFNDD